jgi:hypothetical protein
MFERKKYASVIKGIEKKKKFIVPEGYFENFSSRLQLRLQQETGTPVPKYIIHRISRFNLALAASFIGLIIITYSGIKYLSVNHYNSKTPSLEVADVINYHIHEIDDNMIYDLYAETSLENSGQDGLSDEKSLNAMIDYLVCTDVDIQLIAKEL